MISIPNGGVMLQQPRNSPLNQPCASPTQALQATGVVLPPLSLDAALPSANTGGPPAPNPNLSATPTSDFAQLILSAPRVLTQQIRDQLAVKRVELLERVAREYAISERKYRRNREEKQRSFDRVKKTEQQLIDKHRVQAPSPSPEQDEKEPDNNQAVRPKRRLFASFTDGGSDEKLERVKLKVAVKLEELEAEKRGEIEHEMDHDDRQTLLALSIYFACDWSLVGCDASCVPSMLSGLSTHSGEPDVVSRVLQHIACLFVNAAGMASRPIVLQQLRSTFFNNGGLSLCVGAMLDHPNVLQAQAYGLCILFTLSSSASYCEAMINCGVIAAACCSMNSHPQSFIISNTSSGLLSRICHHNPSMIPYVLQNDGINLILNGMANHPNDVGIHLHSLHCLHQLVGSLSTREQRESLDPRVLETIITTAYTFLNNQSIQMACLTLLVSLCHDSIDTIRMVTKNSGIQMTMLMLSNHCDDHQLIEVALRFLEQIEWHKLECQQALLPVDAFKLFATCITRYAAPQSINQTLLIQCTRIASLTLEHASIQPNNPIQTGLLAAMLSCVKQQSLESIYINIASCLKFMSSHDINKLSMVTAGSLPALNAMLKTYPDNVDIADHATTTFAHLSDHPDLAMRRQLIQSLLTESVIQVMIRTMEQHSHLMSITEQCVKCLFNVLNVSTVPVVNQFVSAGGIAQLLLACKDHSSCEAVQRYCISIFSILSALMDEKDLFLKMNAESINLILIAMRNFPNSLNVLCQSLITLRNLTNKFDCGSTKSGEIIDQVLLKLKTFPNHAHVVQYSAELMWNLALIDPVNLIKLRSGEAVALVLASRRTHINNAAVKHATSGLLEVLECSIMEEGAENNAVPVVGGVVAANQGEAEHGNMNVVQGEIDPERLFIPSPRSLVKFGQSQQQPAAPTNSQPLSSLSSPQPPHAINPAVNAHPQSVINSPDPQFVMVMEIQSLVFRMQTGKSPQLLLFCCDRLCEIAALHQVSHGLIAVHGGVNALIQVLRNNPITSSNRQSHVYFSVEELIQIAGLNTLARLSASSSSLMLAMCRHGGLVAALIAIESGANNPLVVENALSLINQTISPCTQGMNPVVAAEKCTNTSILIRMNTSVMVIRSMLQHCSVLSVQQQAAQVLVHIVDHCHAVNVSSNQTIEQSPKFDEQLVLHLCSVTRTWLSDDKLCESALTLLAHIVSTADVDMSVSSRSLIEQLAHAAQITYRNHAHIQSLTKRLLPADQPSIQYVASSPVGPLSPVPGEVVMDLHGGPPIDADGLVTESSDNESVSSDDNSDDEPDNSEAYFDHIEGYEEGSVASVSRPLFDLSINQSIIRPVNQSMNQSDSQPSSEASIKSVSTSHPVALTSSAEDDEEKHS